MSATATRPATETANPTRGFPGLRCPYCGTEDSVNLNLGEVTAFRCGEDDCEAEWTAADVRELIRQWQRVLSWIEAAPVVE